MVHKIVLPTLKYGSKEWEYSLNNWITSLPDYKNIYLTEISLPGAWYAGSEESYQATTDMTTLWNNGVRAFAVETKTRSGSSSAQNNPDAVVLSGSGSNSLLSYTGGTNSVNEGKGEDKKVYYGGTQIRSIITNIANSINENEFGVLILSYADGGEGGRRYVDFAAWLDLLYEEYNALTDKIKGIWELSSDEGNIYIGTRKWHNNLLLQLSSDEGTVKAFSKTKPWKETISEALTEHELILLEGRGEHMLCADSQSGNITLDTVKFAR